LKKGRLRVLPWKGKDPGPQKAFVALEEKKIADRKSELDPRPEVSRGLNGKARGTRSREKKSSQSLG